MQSVLPTLVFLAFPGFSTYLFIAAPELRYQMDPLLAAAKTDGSER